MKTEFDYTIRLLDTFETISSVKTHKGVRTRSVKGWFHALERQKRENIESGRF